ncbi:ABC transporter substrate-binding protein [Paenirhodobacter populi]|uniref:ABC transporter substrate-binding protein n=1 Tax=Paenirhodobacter populi TaxID=2306993 RepID=UPI000FE439C0|nr:ABC transporter substrate-binding protein [Sinirhodobacter populi]RWR04594.1 ABC transporter substrate-binding protein [Sinirhodobacter populi]
MTLSRRQFNQIALAAGAFVALPGGSFAAASGPVSGGTLRIAYFPEPAQLVALNTSAGGAQFVGSKLFDGLLTYDYDLVPQPGLAREWSVSPDGLEYVFHLQPGVTFHDGAPLTSADVAFSILRLKEAHPRGRVTFAQVESVDSSDPLVARIRLAKPAPALITALAASESPIVPKHIFEALKPDQNPAPAQLIGSGPFTLKEWSPGSHILLERNAAYWDAGHPYLDRVIIRLINDAGARAAALETGEVDIGENPVALAEIERLKSVPSLKIDDRTYAYAGLLNQLVINLDTAELKELKVRQAIAHAIDVPALINIVLYGYGIPSPTPIAPSFTKFHNPDIAFATFDPKISEKLLDEAGFPRKADGKRFRLRVTNNPFNTPAYADFIAQALIAIGIDAEIQRFDFATYVKTVYTDRAWDLSIESLSNMFDPTVGVQRVYWSKNFKIGLPFSNASHYSNPEVDRLLEAAAVEPDIDRRAEFFKEFQTIIAQDLPAINLVVPVQPIIGNVRVQDYAPGAAGLGGNASRTWLRDA